MKEQIANYLDKLDRADNTKQTYLWALNYFADFVGENAVLDMDTYEKFLMYIKNHSPSTKRVFTSALSGLYDFYNVSDPIQIKRINNIYTRKAKTNPVVFDRDAIEKILAHCDDLHDGLRELRDRAFFLTLADSGFRISELATLKRGDIDWNEQRVVVKGKGEKVAFVRLSARSIYALRDYLAARAEMDGKSGKPLGTLPLFAQHGHINRIKPITVDGIRKALKERMKEVGVNVRVHDFRHYFVTIVLIASDNLKLAQELARHESSTTTQRYAHFSTAEIDQRYDEIFNED